jgi:hypothetical protein
MRVSNFDTHHSTPNYRIAVETLDNQGGVQNTYFILKSSPLAISEKQARMSQRKLSKGDQSR